MPAARPLSAAANFFVQSLYRRRRPFRVLPNPGGNGQKVGACIDEWSAVVGGDTTDGDARDSHQLAPPDKNLGIGPRLRLLGLGRKESPESDVIGALLRGDHRQVTRVVTGHADDGLTADEAPGFPVGRVVLTDVDAVATGFCCEVRPVVEKKSDVTTLHNRTEDIAGPADGIIVHVLQAHLDARYVVGVEGSGQPRRKRRRVEKRRRNQVKSAKGLGRLPIPC
jgi:hypothetical protein